MWIFFHGISLSIQFSLHKKEIIQQANKTKYISYCLGTFMASTSTDVLLCSLSLQLTSVKLQGEEEVWVYICKTEVQFTGRK